MSNKVKGEINTNDPLQLLNNRYLEIVVAIQTCEKKKLVLPALIILFTAIDSAAHLYSNNKSVKKCFIEWVERFMIKSQEFSFNSLDLYSARCGILHTLTSNSSLVEKGKAKKGIYSLDDSSIDDLVRILGPNYKNEFFIVKLSELIKLFYKGFLEFFDLILHDNQLQEMVLIKCEKYYSFTNTDELSLKFGIKPL